jgi:hypothetical protein
MLSSAAVSMISAAITGAGAQVQYSKLLLQMGSFSYWPLLRRMPNLRGLLSAFGIDKVLLFTLSVAILLVTALIGAKLRSEPRFLIAISSTALVTYFLFMHDLSLLVLPVFLALEGAIIRQDWRHFVLVSAVLILFGLFWFATDHFYLGALFTSVFLGAQLMELRGYAECSGIATAGGGVDGVIR